MAMQIVNISTPDDGLGDPLRTGGDKINDNFTELDTTTVKVPEDYDPLGSGNFPTTYNGETLISGDTFRVTAADTLGAGTVVAPGDLIIALVSTPGQVDANWLHLVLNATHTGDVTGATVLTIANDVVSNAKLANMPALTIKGNDTGGVADPQDLTAAEVRALLNIADGANNYVHPNHTGDVTSVGDGAQTIQPDVVDNTKLANMPASTLKGNDTGGAADPQDLTPAEVRTLLDVYTTTQVDALIDASLKVPEAYDPAGSGNFPTTYDGNPVTKGDTFRIVTADTLGSGTVVNPEDLLIALVDTPGQTDSNWQVVESNRDQATETVKGVAEIATQVEVDAGTDDERIITPLKLANSVLASNVATNNAKVSFPEAPNDGQEYVRKNEAWAVNSGAGAATELDELSDVTTNFPVTPTEADDGKMLFYDVDLGQWTTDDTVTHGTSIINGKKASAGTILKGTPVYLVGFDADLHTVEAANATSAATMPVIGFAAEDLDDTNSKHIITFGKLTGVDTSSFSVGDDLYMSTTTGQLTTTRPTGTALIQRVAKVLNSDITGGQLLIYNTARTAGLPNLPQNNFWVGDANAEPQALTPAQVRTILNVADGANNYVHPNHTGDVTSVGDGAQTISNNAVTNAKLADMNANRLKGRNTAGVGDPEDLQISALTEELTPAAGDWLLGEDAAGNLIKVNVGNLPGGGGAVNSVTGGVNITNSGTAADPVLDHDAHTGDVTGATALTIAANAVDNSKLADMPALTIKGNDTGVSADPQDLTAAEVRTLLNIADGANNYVHPNHSGDVTSVADGATTIQPDVVDNTKLANMSANRLKGRSTAGVGDPEDLQISALTEELSPTSGDWLLGEDNLGNLIKINVGNLPSGGGGAVNSVTGGVNITNSGTAADPVLDHDAHTGDVTGATALTIAANAVDNTKAADMPANTIKGNDTGAAADPQDLTPTEVRTLINVADGANNYVHPNHSGDVTSVADGATTIQPDVVDNTKLANMPALTIKGNDTGGAADPKDLTVAEAQALLGIGTKLSWQFAAARRANSVTNSYMRMEDGQFMNIAPLIVPVTGTLKAITVASQVNETWTAEVRRAPAGSTTFSVIASLNIVADDEGVGSFNVAVTAGDKIAFYVNGTGIDDPSMTAFFLED